MRMSDIIGIIVSEGDGGKPITNSLGRPLASSPAAIQRFWQWFGRSKIVDPRGQPLVVYHGTLKDFAAFDPARSNKQGGVPIEYHPSFFFTGSTDVAATYAGQETQPWGFQNPSDEEEFKKLAMGNIDTALQFHRKHAVKDVKRYEQGGNVMPVYLRMLKPLRAAGRGNFWNEVWFEDDFISTRDLIEVAIERGYDGIIVKNVHDRREGTGKPSTIYAVFSPNQIKSALGNQGTFDPASAAITETAADISDQRVTALDEQRANPYDKASIEQAAWWLQRFISGSLGDPDWDDSWTTFGYETAFEILHQLVGNRRSIAKPVLWRVIMVPKKLANRISRTARLPPSPKGPFQSFSGSMWAALEFGDNYRREDEMPILLSAKPDPTVVMFGMADLKASRNAAIRDALRRLGDWQYQDEVIVRVATPLPLLSVDRVDTFEHGDYDG